MALESQIVQVDLGKGANTKSDDKYSIPGELVLLENGLFDKLGTINKRPGHADLSLNVFGVGAGALSQLRKLLIYEKSLVSISERQTDFAALGNSYLSKYSPSVGRWSERVGAWQSIVNVDNIFAGHAGSPVQILDSTSQDGVTYYLTSDTPSYDAYVIAYDDTSRSVLWTLANQATVSSGIQKLVLIGSPAKLYLVYQGGTNEIDIVEIQNFTSAPAFGSAQRLADGLDGARPTWDVVEDLAAGLTFFLAHNVEGATQIAVKKFDTTVITGAPSTPSPPLASATIADDADNCLTIWSCDAPGVFVAWANVGNTVKHNFYNSSLGGSGGIITSETPADTVVNITGGPIQVENISAQGYPLLYELNNATSYFQKVKQANITSSTSANQAVVVGSCGLASKVFQDDDLESYVLCVYESPLQSAFYLVRLAATTTATVYRPTFIGRALYGAAKGRLNTLRTLPQPSRTSSPYFELSIPVLAKNVTAGGSSIYPVVLQDVRVSFSDPRRFGSAELGRNLVLSGGSLAMFDGESFVEQGFNIFPEDVTLTEFAGGSLTALGTYSVVIVPEWFDSLGQRHLGAPSVPKTITLTGANQSIQCEIPNIRVTNKHKIPLIGSSTVATYQFRVYRTQNLGTIYYDTGQTVIPVITGTTNTSFALNTASDASIASNETLYTTGGVLENTPPPPSSCIATYNDRVFVGTQYGVYYSKKIEQGDPPSFNDGLLIPVDSLGGEPTALRAFQDKLIIFKKDSIYFIGGDGPNAIGVGGTFSDPEQITADLGTSDPNSIAEIPEGLLFRSDKGIYLLDRGFGLTYVGAQVEYFNTQGYASADVMADKNQVRFLSSDAGGISLVYDYFNKQWSTFTIQGRDAVIWEDDYVYLDEVDGQPRREDSSFRTGGAAYSLKLRTNWLSFTQIQALQRVRRLFILGRFKAHHILTVQFAFDFNPKIIHTITLDTQGAGRALTVIPEAAIYANTAFTGDDIYQFDIHMPRQKFQSVQITISDGTQVSPYESFSITALSFEAGMKKGFGKLKAAFKQ